MVIIVNTCSNKSDLSVSGILWLTAKKDKRRKKGGGGFKPNKGRDSPHDYAPGAVNDNMPD